MIVTTTNIADKKYDVLKIVFSYQESGTGFLKTANPLEAYAKVESDLRSAGLKAGADAVIGACFDYRVAIQTGCGNNGKQIFEVFGYGTAIKFTDVK